MLRLIQMHKDAGEADFVSVDMNATNDPRVPIQFVDMLNATDDANLDDATDKAATSAERIHSSENLEKELQRTRPLTLLVQRDSDAQKNVAASRVNALGTVLICKTCSDLGFFSKKGGTDGFSCARCRASFGPGRFNAQQLKNKKQRPTTTLFCLGCRGI